MSDTSGKGCGGSYQCPYACNPGFRTSDCSQYLAHIEECPSAPQNRFMRDLADEQLGAITEYVTEGGAADEYERERKAAQKRQGTAFEKLVLASGKNAESRIEAKIILQLALYGEVTSGYDRT